MDSRANTLILDKRCLEAARKQFCLDIGMPWEEYMADSQKTAYIKKSVYAPQTMDIDMSGARNYAGTNSFFRAIICLGQLFICCDEAIYDWVVEQYGQCKPEWFCLFSNLRKLEEKLSGYGHRISDTHVYFLPETEDREKAKTEEDLEFLWYNQGEILGFRDKNQFTSAISFWQEHPDVLAVAALKEQYKAEGKTFEQHHLAGMAGTSLDGAYLWQIGINVDKECAGQGLAHRLVRVLKEEVLKRGKVPFYGTSESHTVSQTVGLKAGFAPAWTEVLTECMPMSSGTEK